MIKIYTYPRPVYYNEKISTSSLEILASDILDISYKTKSKDFELIYTQEETDNFLKDLGDYWTMFTPLKSKSNILSDINPKDLEFKGPNGINVKITIIDDNNSKEL